MDADLDLLLTAVYATPDDLLAEKPKNARRSVTDAEVVTLCVVRRSWAYRLTGASPRLRASMLQGVTSVDPATTRAQELGRHLAGEDVGAVSGVLQARAGAGGTSRA
jgi:hypothetical protein